MKLGVSRWAELLLSPTARLVAAALVSGAIALYLWNQVAPQATPSLPPAGNKTVISSDAPQTSRVAAPAAGVPLEIRAPMSEEERSARNEQLFGELERQKRKLGMKVLPKSRTSIMAPTTPPSAPVITHPTPVLLKSAPDGKPDNI